MSPALSPTMQEALEAMRDGGSLERIPGGYWVTPGTPWNGPAPVRYWGTTTVEALVKRGVAQYTEWQSGRNGRFPVKAQPNEGNEAMSAVRIYILRTGDETTFYADETERDLMAKAAVRNGKTAYRQQMDVEPTTQGIAAMLNRLFEGTT